MHEGSWNFNDLPRPTSTFLDINGAKPIVSIVIKKKLVYSRLLSSGKIGEPRRGNGCIKKYD